MSSQSYEAVPRDSQPSTPTAQPLPGVVKPLARPERDMPRCPPASEVSVLLRQAHAIDSLPDSAISDWFDRHCMDTTLHARLGTVMALPEEAPVPPWAASDGVPWPTAELRLLVPLCDAQGALLSVLAQDVRPLSREGALPLGFSHGELLIACPVGRRLLMGLATPKKLIAVADFCEWLRQVEDNQGGQTAVWGLLPHSWSKTLADKISTDCEVEFVEPLALAAQDRILQAKASLQSRVVDGNAKAYAQSSEVKQHD